MQRRPPQSTVLVWRQFRAVTAGAVPGLLIVGCLAIVASASSPAAAAETGDKSPSIVASFAPLAGQSDSIAVLNASDDVQDRLPPLPVAPTISGAAPNCSPNAAEGALGSVHRIPLEASWENGFQLDSPDKQFHFHFGGIGQIDSVWFIGPASAFNAPGGAASTVGNSSATLVRRAILQADGDLLGQFDYSIQFDFANASNENDGEQSPTFGNLTTSPAPLNVWLQIRDVPFFGYVRIGNQDKPIGMDNNTSATDLAFMERSDNQDAFYGPFDNGFALGIAAQNWSQSERVTWRYGIFRPATNVFGVALNKYSIGARVTTLPVYEEEGRELIHLGLGYWGGEIVQDELRDRARPELRNAPGFAVPILVDTSELGGSHQYTIGPEFAMVFGSLTVQAEYAAQFLTEATTTTGQNQGTAFFHGGYVEALYYLTGEYQPYDRHAGVFTGVVPLHDYHLKTGECYHACGAWQVGIRFSYLDLNDDAIQGGSLYDWTAGLNWYLNANVKCQFNYIAEHRDVTGVTLGWINGAGVRVAFNF
jgi:phosphate-selective porin OprO and OprP